MSFIAIIIRDNNRFNKQGIIKSKENIDQSTCLNQGILKGKLTNVYFTSWRNNTLVVLNMIWYDPIPITSIALLFP